MRYNIQNRRSKQVRVSAGIHIGEGQGVVHPHVSGPEMQCHGMWQCRRPGVPVGHAHPHRRAPSCADPGVAHHQGAWQINKQ